MSLSLQSVLLALFVVFASVQFVQYRRWRARLPPGPKGFPIIGNILDIPRSFEWKPIALWKDRYNSDITSARVPGATLIYIHTYEKAKEILDDKSNVYSDRPILPMLGELVGYNDSMPFMRYSPKHRESRKMFYQELGSADSVRNFFAYEEAMTSKMLRLMLKNPDDWYDGVTHHISSIMLRITYGYTPLDKDDPIIRLNEITTAHLSQATDPGGFLVNRLHFLRFLPTWFPGADFRRIGEEWKQDYMRMINVPFNMVAKQWKDGVADDSFTLKWLQQNINEEQQEILKHTSSIMFAAGVETTTTILHLMFHLMATKPDVQKKAQAEIDSVVGRFRLPNLADREHLPYIRALVKEMFRFHPPVPFGVPHRSMQDDFHDGHFIPEGSFVFPNIWQMTRNVESYPNPEVFDVTRFMGPNPQPDPTEFLFGFGRRICPGQRLAETSLYITLVRILAVFKIDLNKDDNGNPIIPTYKVYPGIVSHIGKFDCKVTARDPTMKPEDILD